MPQSPIADPLAWRAVTAPSLVDFEILATEVYRGLPKQFRTLCEDLVIRIEDFATDEILDDMNIDDPFDLLAWMTMARQCASSHGVPGIGAGDHSISRPAASCSLHR